MLGKFYWNAKCQLDRLLLRLGLLLLESPDLLLLDEPSNDLDLQTVEWLEGFLLARKVPVLYISHDETLIERTANMVIHIEQIRRKTVSRYTVSHMPYLQYRQEREDKFEKQARQAASERREKEIRDEKYRRIEQSVEHRLNTVSRQAPG